WPTRRRYTASTSTRAGRRTSCRCGSKTSASPRSNRGLRPKPVSLNCVWSRVGGRTRTLLAAGLRALGPPLGPGYYEGLEELLITADVGPSMAVRLSSEVRKRAPHTLEEARGALVDAALGLMSRESRAIQPEPAPACILMYGVNGAGKTTTIGKLAYSL